VEKKDRAALTERSRDNQRAHRREAIETPLPSLFQALHEFPIACVRMHLGEQAFDTAWAEGRSMTPEQTLRDG
jgi:hypothetical protein